MAQWSGCFSRIDLDSRFLMPVSEILGLDCCVHIVYVRRGCGDGKILREFELAKL